MNIAVKADFLQMDISGGIGSQLLCPWDITTLLVMINRMWIKCTYDPNPTGALNCTMGGQITQMWCNWTHLQWTRKREETKFEFRVWRETNCESRTQGMPAQLGPAHAGVMENFSEAPTSSFRFACINLDTHFLT